MDWLNAEIIVAVVTALLSMAASTALLLYERRVPRRKRIGYRIQMDTPIGSNSGSNHTARPDGQDNVRLGLFHEDRTMRDATLVLLRFENDGSQSISIDDYTGTEPYGLTAQFTGRQVHGISVTLPEGAEHLMGHFAPGRGLGHHGETLYIPRVRLNSGAYFKILVLLRGGHVGGDIHVRGGLQDGELHKNHSTTPDEKPPLFSRPARWLTALLMVGVLLVTTLVIVQAQQDAPPPVGCARGRLTVVGSTAFGPVARELETKYEKDCPGSDIVVETRGSSAGILELAQKGEASKSSPPLVALSDGPKPQGHPRLRENRLAISAFAMVVNDTVPVRNLSLRDLRRLYRGEIRNWKELGGPSLPVVLVSRNSNSGTRVVFQRRILESFELAESSADCRERPARSAPVFRCELDSTDQVLDAVADIPGAIGYSELRSTTTPKGLHRLSLDGHAPPADDLTDVEYPFREIEYAYTYGRPPADSLASSFLNYAMRGNGQDVVRIHGHLPCFTPEGLTACAAQ